MEIITRFSINQPVIYEDREYTIQDIHIRVFLEDKTFVKKLVERYTILSLKNKDPLLLPYDIAEVDVSHFSPVETNPPEDMNIDEMCLALDFHWINKHKGEQDDTA